MRVKEVEIDNKRVQQVYITQSEKDSEEIRRNIECLKEKNENVVVFLAGGKDIMNTIKGMLQLIHNNSMY